MGVTFVAMPRHTLFGLFILLAVIAVASASQIRRYPENNNNELNTYLIWDDDDSALLVDAGPISRNRTTNLISFIQSVVPGLTQIFLSNGDVEHWGAVPQLVSIFPQATVLVGSSEIRQEIIRASSTVYPNSGYDWTRLKVADDDDTFDEYDLTIFRDFPPVRSNDFSVLYHADQNYVITGDILYIKMHPDLGEPLNLQRLHNWYEGVLPDLAAGGKLGLNTGTRYYPAHGPDGSHTRVDQLISYLRDDFETNLFTCPSQEIPKRLSALADDLIAKYPTYGNRAGLDEMENNQDWVTAQQQVDPCARWRETGNSATSLAFSAVLVAAAFLLM